MPDADSLTGSEYHPFTAHYPWTALLADACGSIDFDAYIAIPCSELPLHTAVAWFASAGNFRTAPSASMAGGVRLFDGSRQNYMSLLL
jgi:hypothetical protein